MRRWDMKAAINAAQVVADRDEAANILPCILEWSASPVVVRGDNIRIALSSAEQFRKVAASGAAVDDFV